jgi:hypothetical protein
MTEPQQPSDWLTDWLQQLTGPAYNFSAQAA